MRPRRILLLAAVIVLLGTLVTAVALMTVAALPTALALGLAVLALIAGIGTRLRRFPGRRAHPTTILAEVGHDQPVAESGESPLRWTAVWWDSRPPMHMLPGTRERVAVVLAEWGLTGEAVEPTLLVVTELLSNAIEHGRGPGWLSLELADEAMHVHVRVRDDASEQPTLHPPNPLQVRGRGLQLVEALSLRWGWFDDPPGKVVWAEVPTRWPA
jgi:hypothetical protein